MMAMTMVLQMMMTMVLTKEHPMVAAADHLIEFLLVQMMDWNLKRVTNIRWHMQR